MQRNNGVGFRKKVEDVVSKIPRGKVMTYGQVAALCGSARAARVVGGIAHYGDQSLPWHRVVNARGGLASGYPGGRAAHGRHLANEGIVVNARGSVELCRYSWRPKQVALAKDRLKNGQ